MSMKTEVVVIACLLTCAACTSPPTTKPVDAGHDLRSTDGLLNSDGSTPSDGDEGDAVQEGVRQDSTQQGDTLLVDGGPGSDTSSDALSGDGLVAALITGASNAISSYLMLGSAWNLFHGSTVYLGRRTDDPHVSYHTALRFEGIAIPQGATIQTATLSFYPQNDLEDSTNLWINIYAERTADSAAFDPADYDAGRPDQRLKTSAHIDHWLVRCNASCTDLTEYDCDQRKLDCWRRTTRFDVPKDLKELVQEVVGQAGWGSGNALTLLLVNAAIDEDGKDYRDNRSITGYDLERGASFAPRLVVSYTE